MWDWTLFSLLLLFFFGEGAVLNIPGNSDAYNLQPTHWDSLDCFGAFQKLRRKREGRRERRERKCSLMSQNCLCHLTMLTFRLTAKTSVHYTFVLGLHSRGLSVSSTPPHYSAHPGSPASGSSSAPNLPRIKATVFLLSGQLFWSIKGLGQNASFLAPLSREMVWVRKTQASPCRDECPLPSELCEWCDTQVPFRTKAVSSIHLILGKMTQVSWVQTLLSVPPVVRNVGCQGSQFQELPLTRGSCSTQDYAFCLGAAPFHD